MISRRNVITTIGVFACPNAFPQPVSNALRTSSTFDVLFSNAMKNPESLLQTRREREGLSTELDLFHEKAIAPRYEASKRHISADAINMILAFEIGSEHLYKNKFQRPIWPRGQSGVTIGIGYDIGYTTDEWLKDDWGDILPSEDLHLLSKACRITGEPASTLIPGLTGINISWIDANKQFAISLGRFISETLAVLPNANKLSDDSLGALVSLDYNRGANFKSIGDRYVEMRAIRRHLVNEEYYKIPDEIRKMARLWRNSDVQGLVIRRNLEAALFERGMRS